MRVDDVLIIIVLTCTHSVYHYTRTRARSYGIHGSVDQYCTNYNKCVDFLQACGAGQVVMILTPTQMVSVNT